MSNPAFIIGSAALFLVALGMGVHTYMWVKDASGVTGTVVEMIQTPATSRKGPTSSPRVAYEMSGNEKEFVSTQSSHRPAFRVGDKVRVAVNERKGKECIANFEELYGFQIVLGLIALCVAAATVVLGNGDRLLKFLHPQLA